MLLLIEIFITVIYLLYVQFSPQMGNIWWRNDYFSPMGAIKIIVYPLYEIKMWNMEFWDINYFIWLLFGVIINFIINLNDILYINENGNGK
jgi:hypothetical protein|tara:strand:+ start:483 stop:755 length:273 start_codon:yes stop_codon:yes gene_type:complete